MLPLLFQNFNKVFTQKESGLIIFSLYISFLLDAVDQLFTFFLSGSPKFRSFSYLYNEEQFIAALSNDVVVVKSLPKDLKEVRKTAKFPTFSPQRSASPSFYIKEVLPKLKSSKVVGLLITDGGCLEVGVYFVVYYSCLPAY